MTEQEWLACERPEGLLKLAHGHMTDRKWRLFACACCRRIWPHFPGRRSLEAVVTAERFADSLPGGEHLPAAHQAATRAYEEAEKGSLGRDAAVAARIAATIVSTVRIGTRGLQVADICANVAKLAANHLGAWAEERAAQAALLRDMVGNPFRPVSLDPAWLAWKGGTVGHLARTISDEGRFDEVPILADALEDAGCGQQDLLGHCRQPRHARGCWAVDLVLGRK
jgi:hypothetical protein